MRASRRYERTLPTHPRLGRDRKYLRDVPLNGTALAALERLRAESKGDFVFPMRRVRVAGSSPPLNVEVLSTTHGIAIAIPSPVD